MEHLEPIQVLDLEHARSLGPLFEQSRSHLSECPQCRRMALECDALRALALEAGLNADAGLLKRSLQAAKKLDVSERLSQQTGEEAAREILLQPQEPGRRPWLPGLYAGLALLAGLGFYYFESGRISAPAAKANQDLPFEFQNQADAGVSGTASDAIPGAEPALSSEEKADDNAKESQARRLMISNLSRENQGATKVAIIRAPSTPVPTLSVSPTAVPTSVRVEADSVDFRTAAAPETAPLTDVAPPTLTLSNSRLSVSGGVGIDFLMSLPEDGQVELRIFDATGKTVRLLADGRYGPGDVKMNFNGRGDSGGPLSPGVYYARVMTRWFSRVEPLDLKP